MFQERPYRQQRQANWSIWWFVAFMAAGLTMWHLELIPFIHQNEHHALMQRQQMNEQFLDGIPENIDQHHNSMIAVNQPQEIANSSSPSIPPGQIEPEPMATQVPPQFLNDMNSSKRVQANAGNSTQATEHHSEPPMYQVSVTTGENSIQQASHEVPVQTLPYRKLQEPAVVQTLPFRGDTPPVQYASTPEQTHNLIQPASATQQVSPVMTANHIETETAQTLLDAVPATQAQQQTSSEEQVRQLRELSTLYWQKPEMRAAIEQDLLTLSQQIYFSPDEHYLPAHQVMPNEHLETIAKQYDVSWQYLAELNRITPERLRAGEEIKVIQGPFDAIVELSNFRLTVHAHGYVMAIFPIGVGQQSSTPQGQFAVLNKLSNPTYYGPDGVIGRDDPNNPLGEYWVDLGNSIGIHGTIDPNSIGQACSQGCIRMKDEDIAQVFDLLTTKSRVVIRP